MPTEFIEDTCKFQQFGVHIVDMWSPR